MIISPYNIPFRINIASLVVTLPFFPLAIAFCNDPKMDGIGGFFI